MIQIIVVTHGNLARELVNTIELIVGRQEALTAIGLEMHEGIEDLSVKIMAAIREEDKQVGCLVVVDMFGGTPSNVAMVLTRSYPIEIVTGVNLPMLIEAVTHRSLMNLTQLTEFAKEKGQKAIIHANQKLVLEKGTFGIQTDDRLVG